MYKTNSETPAEMLAKTKAHFGTTYADLLQMHLSRQPDDLIEKIREFVKEEGKSATVTTHQLRNIYDKVKGLPETEEGLVELKLLRPMLAYIAARQTTMRTMAALFDDLIKSASKPIDVKGMKNFMQAVVAYQKYFEKINE
jgi:CRISPR type III-A-associated protein Csm2